MKYLLARFVLTLGIFYVTYPAYRDNGAAWIAIALLLLLLTLIGYIEGLSDGA